MTIAVRRRRHFPRRGQRVGSPTLSFARPIDRHRPTRFEMSGSTFIGGPILLVLAGIGGGPWLIEFAQQL
jgi:hypothetical protein